MPPFDPDTLVSHLTARAMRGLRGVAADAQADMQATRAHGDITGAARASYRAYPVGPGADESQAVSSAISAVASLNPGAEAVQDYRLPAGHIGVILTMFVTYGPELQTEEAGRRAALKPTLDAYADQATRAAAEGR